MVVAHGCKNFALYLKRSNSSKVWFCSGDRSSVGQYFYMLLRTCCERDAPSDLQSVHILYLDWSGANTTPIDEPARISIRQGRWLQRSSMQQIISIVIRWYMPFENDQWFSEQVSSEHITPIGIHKENPGDISLFKEWTDDLADIYS